VRAYPKPTLVYTQNALGGLPPAWVAALSTADGIIVPGVFDQKIFSQYFDRVYIASQSSDPAIFKPYPGWRSEGSASFTFLFVGSYSFRKGVDLLLEAFLAEFEPDEPVELLLQVPGAGRGDEFNHCLRILQRVNPYGHLRLNGAHLAPEWMNRLYNRSDCVVTLSRGEGWCMPLTEALLSETPVIAPNSTAMGEYLDASVADMVSTRELPASDAPTPFGTPFADVYGFPGVTYYEPDIDEARSAMRRVFQDHASAVKKARIGRQRVLSEYSWAHSARQVASACHALLEPRITTSR
jgi:glycosyltransferase involved in cell wall biosynthesis